MNGIEMMKENLEIIRKVCCKYRRELTITAGVVGGLSGLFDSKDYIEFANTWSDDLFAGNYLGTLLIPYGMEAYKKLLENGDFEDFLIMTGLGYCSDEVMRQING